MESSVSFNQPSSQGSLELMVEVYRYRDLVQELISENNQLKTKLSEVLEYPETNRMIQEAEDFHGLFILHEESLYNLCARSRKQLSTLLREDGMVLYDEDLMRHTQQELWEKLEQIRGEMSISRKAFDTQFAELDRNPSVN